jgi:hypothetical protein
MGVPTKSETAADAHTPAYRVFVSHATADKRRAVRLCRMLEAAGAGTFRDDKDIYGGDDIPARVKAEMRLCEECVVILTPNSISRPWVWLEVGLAIAAEIRIVPILCEISIEQAGPLRAMRAFTWRQLDRYILDVQRRLGDITP